MSSPRDPKLQGEQAECAFLLQATRRGLIVSKPWGDTARYDFVVDNGSRLLRVQVKSVSVLQDGTYHISTGSGHSSKTAYTPRDIDLLAAYVIPEDAWYLIPIRALSPRKTIHLCPHQPGCRRNFEKYREAWDVMQAGVRFKLTRKQPRNLLRTAIRIRAGFVAPASRRL